MKRIGGFRRKTRYLSKKSLRSRGKISIARYLQSFKIGERVKLSFEPAIQKGMYNPSFYGRDAIVEGKKGKCYEVMLMDGSKRKNLIIHPIHLKKVQNG